MQPLLVSRLGWWTTVLLTAFVVIKIDRHHMLAKGRGNSGRWTRSLDVAREEQQEWYGKQVAWAAQARSRVFAAFSAQRRQRSSGLARRPAMAEQELSVEHSQAWLELKARLSRQAHEQYQRRGS